MFYIPTSDAWQAACARMELAGFLRVVSFNPYWDVLGRTFVDPDGYRIVLQQGEWSLGDATRGDGQISESPGSAA